MAQRTDQGRRSWIEERSDGPEAQCHEVFAVNPHADEVEEARSYPGEGTVRECAELDIRHAGAST